MSKPSLQEPYATLEHQIIETLIAGHKEWRPDLDYPESYSDMQAAVRGLLKMFEVRRRALPQDIKEWYRSAAAAQPGDKAAGGER